MITKKETESEGYIIMNRNSDILILLLLLALLGIGTFLSTVIDFFLVAFVIFLMVKTINQLHKLGKKDEEPQEEEEEPAPTSEELLTEIRDLLKEQQK